MEGGWGVASGVGGGGGGELLPLLFKNGLEYIFFCILGGGALNFK